MTAHDTLVRHIAETYAIHPKIAEILVQKGITTPELVRATFEPTLSNLVSWQTLPDIEALLRAVDQARQKQQRILVWGHEDADGFTSVAVLLAALQHLGLDTRYYVPSKRKEGHGLGEQGFAYARDQGVSLILTVDCCGSDRAAVARARELGFQVVLTDHHELPRELPEAPLVNPKRGGGSFPYLAGVGVALKAAWALLDAFQGLSLQAFREAFPWSFAYAAIGTVADRVPLFSENKIIADEGLRALEASPPPFVQVLTETLGQPPALDLLISVVSSGKRRDHRHEGVDLLLHRDPAALKPLLNTLLQGVQEYRSRGDALLNRAMQEIRSGRRYLLIDLQDAEPQYLGYVASRLKDLYGVPTVVLGRKQEEIVAEVRAPYGFNSLELLHALSPLFTSYGGHKAASGFSMPPENLASLVEEMELYFRSYRPRLEDQVDLKVSDMTPELWQSVEKVARLGVDLRLLTRFDPELMRPSGPAPIPPGRWVLVSTGPNGIQIHEVPGLEDA